MFYIYIYIYIYVHGIVKDILFIYAVLIERAIHNSMCSNALDIQNKG